MRYKRGVIDPNDELETIFSRYKVSKETEFVKEFFQPDEINTILEECGFDPLDEDYEIFFEYPVKIGLNDKRADVLVKSSNNVFYFEIMSQSSFGKWDNSHHEQFILKSYKLKQSGEDVYCFAISFKEFEPSYLEDIEKDPSMFGVHLRFSNDHYYVDVYGKEEKKKMREFKDSMRKQNVEKIAKELLDLGKRRGYTNRADKVKSAWYAYIGKGLTSNHEKASKTRQDFGLEIGLHSKTKADVRIHGFLQHAVSISKEEVLEKMKSKFSEIDFSIGGQKWWYLSFPFNYESYTLEDLEKALNYLEEFASVIGYSHLIKPHTA